MSRIVAIDPGGTCGWAKLDLTSNGKQLFRSGQGDPFEVLASVEADLRSGNTSLLVCESFFISAATLKKSRQYDALYTIGALNYLSQACGVEFELQAPFERLFATNDRLKQLGWRKPTVGGHADDAARHLMVACIRRGIIDATQFLDEEEKQ